MDIQEFEKKAKSGELTYSHTDYDFSDKIKHKWNEHWQDNITGKKYIISYESVIVSTKEE